MNKLLVTAAATSLLMVGASAFAADMPAPMAPPRPVMVFNWTSCYAGAHVGGGWASKDVTDPTQLVQDQLLAGPFTVGATTVGLRPDGYLIGGQFGCDYQPVGSNWVVGFEGAASGGNIKGSSAVALPLGDPGDLAVVSARIDFLAAGTVRFGYTWDRLLFYMKGGAGAVGDNYSVVGVFQGVNNPTPFSFQGVGIRIGWTVGAGVEWALWDNWSAKLEYEYYDFGHKSVLMTDNNLALTGPVDIRQAVQAVKLGLNFRMWSSQW
jgi:outer membrane immunogenic protein